MRLRSILFVFLALLVLGGIARAQEAQREWVDKSGKYKIIGTFQKITDGNVFLKKDDGSAIKIPLVALSAEDQEHIRKIERLLEEPKQIGDPDPPPTNDPKIDSPKMEKPSSETPTKSPPKSPNELTAVDSSAREPDPAKRRPVKNQTGAKTGLEVDLPTEDFDFLNEDASNFQSTVDVREVDMLPVNVREPARTLHKRTNVVEVAKAFHELSKHDSLPPTVIQLIQETARSDNKYYRIQSVKLLATFDPENSFEMILNAASDKSFGVRVTALDALGYLKNPQSIDTLVAQFPGRDRSKIVTVLTEFGPVAEEKVFSLLSHQNRTVVADAIRLLDKIGTEKSIAQLTPLLDSKVVIRMQAKSTIENIRQRLGL